MAYTDDIVALSPDHLWTFDNTYADSIGSLTGVSANTTFSTAIAEGATNSLFSDTALDTTSIPTSADLNGSAQDRKTIAGWVMVDSYQLPPKSIYREGTTTLDYIQFVMWAGNKVMFEASNNGGANPQAISNKIFKPNRAYHICGKIEGSGYGNFIELYVDGVKQNVTLPSDGSFGDVSLNSRDVAEFGASTGTTYVGQGLVLLNALDNGYYNYWATWQGANAQLTATQIREELFEKGAIPDIVITSQAELDTLANSIRPDSPLCIRVDVAGSIDLTADNVKFDKDASIHVQYTGTGTMNWTNINGSNASISSTPNVGTVNFINPSTLTINGIIPGSEVRIYDNEVVNYGNNDTELAGIESNPGTTFNFNHDGSTNAVVLQVMASGYKEIRRNITLGSSNQTVTVFPEVETN